MSYIYLQEQGEESSAESFLDIPQSVLSRLNFTAEKSYSKDSGTESFQSSQSGTMCRPSMESPGLEKLMLCAEDFHAKTYPVKEQSAETLPALTDSVLDCGANTRECLAKYDPNTHLLKTRQTLLFEDSTECFATLPLWGILLNGELSEQTPPVTTICANESGLLPTVMATDWKGGTTAIRKDKGHQRLDQWRHYVKCKYGMTYPHPIHSELRMGWIAGWTDLKPLEMDKFRLWLLSHGKSFHPGVDKH